MVFGLIRVPMPLDGHLLGGQVLPGEVIPDEKIRKDLDLRVFELQEVAVRPAAAGLPLRGVGETGIGAVVNVLYRRDDPGAANPRGQKQGPDAFLMPGHMLDAAVEVAVNDAVGGHVFASQGF